MRDEIPVRRSFAMIALLTICYVFSLIDRLVINLLVDPIKADLALSDLQIALIQGPAFAILYATSGVPLGRLADVVNRRNLTACAIGFWSICTALTGAAASFTTLALARVGVGVGEAALTPAAYSLFADGVRTDRLGRAISVYTAGGALGSGLALVVGGAIYAMAESAGIGIAPWRVTLFVVAAPGLVLALLIMVLVVEPVRRDQATRPKVGAVLQSILRSRRFYGWAFLAYAALGTLLYGFMAWAPSFLVRGYGLSPATAGLRFGSAMLIAGVAGPMLAGWLADRISRKLGVLGPLRVMLIGFICAALCVLVLPFEPGIAAATAALGFIGFFATGMLGLVPIAIQLATPGNMRGLASGMNLMIGNLFGMGIGPVAVATLSKPFGLGGALSIVVVLSSLVGLAAILLARTTQTLDEPDKAR